MHSEEHKAKMVERKINQKSRRSHGSWVGPMKYSPEGMRRARAKNGVGRPSEK